MIDYSEDNSNASAVSRFPPQNTIYVLEVKQNLYPDQVLDKISKRVNATLRCISPTRPKIRKRKVVQSRLASQESFFNEENYNIRVAVGAPNLNESLARVITSAGHLAIIPTGDDFEVLQ